MHVRVDEAWRQKNAGTESDDLAFRLRAPWTDSGDTTAIDGDETVVMRDERILSGGGERVGDRREDASPVDLH
jgi:hypothetical protein